MNKHRVIALKRHSGFVQVHGDPNPVLMNLPPGCDGILFVFESKKAAREYWGKDVETVRVEVRDANV